MSTHTLTRRAALRWLATGSGLAVLAACGSPAPAAPSAVQPTSAPTGDATAAPLATTQPTAGASGSLAWAVLGVPPTLDPFVTTDPNATVLLRALHAPLIDFKPDGTMVPNLASDWKAEPGGWTIRLRGDAKFSDGSPVVADDLKASFDFWTDPANKYSGGTNLLPYIKSASVVDGNTVRFETPNPDAMAIKRMFQLYTVPKAILSQGLQSYVANPIGTGSYRYKSFKTSDSLVVEPNPNSWVPGKVASITFQALPDEAARAQALRAGQVNIAARLTSDTAVPARSAGKNVLAFDSGQTIYVSLGYSNPRAADALKDPRVRRAVALAVNAPEIVKAVEGEYGKPAVQVARPEDIGYNPGLTAYPTDLAQAKQLIQDAGAQGAKLKIAGVSNDVPMSGRIGLQAVAEAMSSIGLDVEIDVLDIVVYLTQYQTGELSAVRNGALVDVTYDLGVSMLGFQGARPEGYWYHTPEVDKLLADANAELDPSKRAPLMQQVAQKIHDDIPAVPLAYEQAISAMDSTVKNFRTGGWAVPDYTALSVG
jgi:peptide/nickel transport system substrate-binding protein